MGSSVVCECVDVILFYFVCFAYGMHFFDGPQIPSFFILLILFAFIFHFVDIPLRMIVFICLQQEMIIAVIFGHYLSVLVPLIFCFPCLSRSAF